MTTAATDCSAEARPGLRERQRRARESAILDAAFALIADVGYEAMTMDALAVRARLSKPTLYNHFPSKEAIAVRALVRLSEDATATALAIDPTLPPIVRLEAFVRWLVGVRFQASSAAFLQARAALTPARAHPDYVHAAQAKLGAVAGLIRAAQDASEIDRAAAPEVLAQTLFALVCHTEYDDLIAAGQARPDDVAQAVTRLFLDGLRATGGMPVDGTHAQRGRRACPSFGQDSAAEEGGRL